MSAQLIDFPVPERSRFSEAWAMRPASMKTRGEGSEKTKKRWDEAAQKVGGQSVLLEAFKRYLREDKDNVKWGFPGLSVWLNQQRYDHWLEASETGQTSESRQRAPEPFRSQIVSSCGEDWTRSYLDPCTFHEDGFITPATDYAKGKLLEKKEALRACGVAGIRKRE